MRPPRGHAVAYRILVYNSSVNGDRSKRLGARSVSSESAAERDYGDLLWAPSAQAADGSEIARFARWLAGKGGPVTSTYQDLWQWSVPDLAGFWSSIWNFFCLLGDRRTRPLPTGPIPRAPWLPG